MKTGPSMCGLGLVVAVVFGVGSQSVLAAPVTPAYQYQSSDPTWQNQGSGTYTVSTNAENYKKEIWERPIEDDKWSDSADTRTSTGEYWSYVDLSYGAFGYDDDYAYARWDVVGDYKDVGGTQSTIGYDARYNVYFGIGENAYSLNIAGGKGDDLGAEFAGNSDIEAYGPVKDSDVLGTGIEDTGEGISSSLTGWGSETKDDSRIFARRTGSTVEVAVKLDVFKLEASDFDNLEWAYLGTANSNPSSMDNVFANDAFASAIGSGVEYDTLQVVPIPAAAWLFGSAILSLVALQRRKV